MSQLLHHMIASGPRPVAPFSHAVEADGWVFITGQMPTNPEAPDAPWDPLESTCRHASLSIL